MKIGKFPSFSLPSPLKKKNIFRALEAHKAIITQNIDIEKQSEVNAAVKINNIKKERRKRKMRAK